VGDHGRRRPRQRTRTCGPPANVVDPRAPVITVAGAGSAAAIALNADLTRDDVRGTVLVLDQGLTP
jgi:hypothetical protein